MYKLSAFFKIIGFLSLIIVCFYGTNEAILVVREMDDLLIEIKEKSNDYVKNAKPAIIKGDTIIPGITGLKVNVNKSYLKMKEYGKFNENLIVYEKLKPDDLLHNNLDKYIISGNPEKRMVSLIFLVNNNDEIDKIRDILKNKKVSATFFLDGEYVESHLDQISDIKLEGHTLGNYSYNKDYNNSSFVWVDTIFKRLGNQDNNYCITLKKNKDVLKNCSLHHDYTIVPDIYTFKEPLGNIKKNVKNGSLIALESNNEIELSLSTIISYLKSKGYKLVNLETILSE